MKGVLWIKKLSKCNKTNFILKIVILIFIVIFSISLYFIVKDFSEYKQNDELTEELIENVVETNPTTEETTINWQHLKSINNDIIGWIEVQNTKINYPILKDDNLFYLKHSYDKKYNSNGSIFTTNINPFIDEETIIYGHNMKNRKYVFYIK